MARPRWPQEPVARTGRWRRIAALLVAVATTSTAVVLTVPGLVGTDPDRSAARESETMRPMDPSGDGAPTAGDSTDPMVPEISGPEPAVPPAGAPVVNGREQPPRVEPPAAASGRLAVVPGSAASGPGTTLLTYRVEIEADLPFDGPEFAAAVHATLADPRGWAARGYAFQRVNGAADMRIILASPALTDQLCAPLLTRGVVSCRNGEAIVLNALRWGTGIDDYAGDLATYREYMVNHEVGHRLGRGHVSCPGAGQLAPVMMQQTYGLGNCLANAWPLPGE